MRDDVAIPSPHGWLNVADGIFHNARRRPPIRRSSSAGAPSPTRNWPSWWRRPPATWRHRRQAGRHGRRRARRRRRPYRGAARCRVARRGHPADGRPLDRRGEAPDRCHFGARFVLVPEGETPIAGIETVALDEAWRRGVARSCRRGAVRAPARAAAAAVAVVRHHRHAEGPAGDAWPYAEPAVYLHDQPDLQRRRPLHRGDPALFRRRALHDMAYLFMGATVVLFPPPYQAEELARAVNEQSITSLFLVPTLLRRLLEMPKGSLPLFARRAPADLVGREPLSATSGAASCASSVRTSSTSTARPRAAASRCCGPSIPTRRRCRSARWCSAPRWRSSTTSIGRWRRDGRRDPLSRRQRRRQLLPQSRGERGRVPRRLVLSGRSRPVRRRRLPPSHRPRQGHDHPRRRQHLSGRDRADAGRARRGGRGRGGRLAVAGARRGGRGLRGVPVGGERAGADRALPRVAGAVQDPERDLLPRRIAEERTRQGAQAGSWCSGCRN